MWQMQLVGNMQLLQSPFSQAARQGQFVSGAPVVSPNPGWVAAGTNMALILSSAAGPAEARVGSMYSWMKSSLFKSKPFTF